LHRSSIIASVAFALPFLAALRLSAIFGLPSLADRIVPS
jgi:hypothetical protein